MSISGFTEELLKRLDQAFEQEANSAFNAVRAFDSNRSIHIVGKSDGLHAAAEIIKDTYKLFVTPDNDEDTDVKPLY
jgi:thymidine kinase